MKKNEDCCYMSLRSKIISTLIRPNKLLYRIIRPSSNFIRFFVHPPSWLGGKILSSFSTRVERTEFGGIPGVTFTPKIIENEKSIIVYLHGGGYSFGSSLTTHRIGLSNLAKITGKVCHSIDYRLAPEFQYPAALDDAIAAWKNIVNQNSDSEIILMGDSAGGGLSLALLLYLRDNNEKLPNGFVLFSPWTDLTCNSNTYQTKAKADPMFYHQMPKDASERYVPKSFNKSDPYISPIYGDFTGFPKGLIIVGENEILLDDSRIVAENAKKKGVEIDIQIWPKMFHDWWLFGPLLPESKKCLLGVQKWINGFDV